jgi:hypothetical protein
MHALERGTKMMNFKKKIYLSKFLYLICFLSITFTFNAQAQLSNVTFAFTKEQREYTRYVHYSNKFDLSFVTYTFGEVKVIDKNGSRRIKVPANLGNVLSRQSQDTIGESTDLLQYGRTNTFSYSADSVVPVISFYRQMLNSVGCNDEPPSGGDGNPWDFMDIIDQTEFVIQLVKSSDNSVVAVLDSVGSTPTNSMNNDTRYGTGFNTAVVTRALPTTYANTDVYLQISPRRFGPTPYGIAVSRLDQKYNLSAMFDADGNALIPDSLMPQLQVNEFNAIIAYCDSVKNTTGWLPPSSERAFSFGSDSLYKLFANRYGKLSPGGKGFTESEWPIANARSGANSLGKVLELNNKILTINSSNPIIGDIISVIISANAEHSASSLFVTDLEGRNIGMIWAGKISKGKNNLTLDISNNPNGTYLLGLVDEKGRTVSSQKIIIQR